MFDSQSFRKDVGSVAVQDGVTIQRSPCCVNVYFNVAGFNKEQIKVDVDEDGTVSVNADNGSDKRQYSILVGDVETPEKRVSFNGKDVLSVTFAKAKKKLTVS